MSKVNITDGGRISTGFTAETNDCTVRAFAVAFNSSYLEAHNLFKQFGRKDRKGMSVTMLSVILGSKGVNLVQGKVEDGTYMLKYFIESHPVGTYYMVKRKHAFVVKDGVVWDMKSVGGRSQVLYYAKVG